MVKFARSTNDVLIRPLNPNVFSRWVYSLGILQITLCSTDTSQNLR